MNDNFSPSMPADLKQRWVAALRSGKYEQCTGVLYELTEEDECDTYCCLGVLVAVATRIDGDLVRNNASPDENVPSWSFYSDYNIRLADGNLGFEIPVLNTPLTILNDELQLTFEQIADVVDYFVEST